MATNVTCIIPIAGVNLEGNDSPITDGSLTLANSPPLLALLTPVLISGNRVAIYTVANDAINPGATCTVSSGGSSQSTTGTGQYFACNIATCATGEYIWCRDITALTV